MDAEELLGAIRSAGSVYMWVNLFVEYGGTYVEVSKEMVLDMLEREMSLGGRSIRDAKFNAHFSALDDSMLYVG